MAPSVSTGRIFWVSLLILISPQVGNLLGQENGPEVLRDPVVGGPVYPYDIEVDLRSLPLVEPWEPGDPIKDIPRRGSVPIGSYEGPTEGFDPLLDSQAQVVLRGGTGFGQPIIDIEGGTSGAQVPDTVGDVGLNYYIQAINGSGTQYRIYSKVDGSLVAGPFTLASFSPCSGGGDPVVIYDELAQRWVLAEFGDSSSVCVLVSKSADPINGGWWEYGFPTPNFPDYPKLSVWPDAYYLSTNENSGVREPACYALDRSAMLNGLPATSQRFVPSNLMGFGFQALTPADMDGEPPAMGASAPFMRHRDDEGHNPGVNDPSQDFLEIFEFHVDFAVPANSTFTGPFNLAVTEFDSHVCDFNSTTCFTQPSSSTRLDPITQVIMFRLQYRNFGTHESLVGNHVTDVDGSDHGGVRWFELRRKGSNWFLFQEGTFAPDADNRWMGAIAMDRVGNIALGYNAVSGGLFPSLRYAGRLVSDPLGSLTLGEHELGTGTAPNTSNRYGDYAQMSVDPSDDCTFWFTGEYNPSTQWRTRIAAFKFDTCACEADPPGNVDATANGANRIDVTWSAVTGSDSYNVYRALGSCPQNSFQLLAEELGDTLFVDSTVSGNGTYAYVVTNNDGVLLCESLQSDCADAMATGDCFLPPQFDGLVSVTDQQTQDCGLQLTWSPAQDSCATSGVVYNVYRSVDPGFLPNAGNRIVSCQAATSYLDEDIDTATDYFYIVRAEDQVGTGPGPCGGNEESNTVRVLGNATGPDIVAFEDDIEGGAILWASSPGPGDPGGTTAWSIIDSVSHSPSHAWFVEDEATVKDQLLATVSPVEIADSGSPVLVFWHRHNTQFRWDGGVLEYSVNGSNWFDILQGDGDTIDPDPLRILQNGYNQSLNAGSANPLTGRMAWTGNSGDWQQVIVDLEGFSGRDIYFRWRLGCDASTGGDGWYLDDVLVFSGTQCSVFVCPGYELWPGYDIRSHVGCVQ